MQSGTWPTHYTARQKQWKKEKKYISEANCLMTKHIQEYMRKIRKKLSANRKQERFI